MARGKIIAALALTVCLTACQRTEPTRPAPAAAVATPQVAAMPGAAPVASATLKAVRARGRLLCGVQGDLPGFASRDVLGQWRGFDVDICRAVAAAVFRDARAVRIVPLDARDRFTALQAGQIDMLARGGWAYTRDAGLGLDFTGVTYFDGQGFLAPVSLGLVGGADLRTLRICVEAGTTSELNLVEYLRSVQSKARSVVVDSLADAVAAYQDGRCEILSANRSTLASILSGLRRGEDHALLPDVISKEPLGPVVRQGDDVWADIVSWSINALILAEEMGLSSRTVAEARQTPPTPEIGRLLSGDGYGPMLTLSDDWAFQIVRQVGTYGDVFERNLGADSNLKLERGRNALWNAEAPGLLFSPPMR